ncbi:hypothetical protein PR048_018558 [Dryococelus australis]|uniref:Rx N-terminal domain-containing protein n=1 Tax=Dryococelus australis TaxID=614101 RepID=A0ABQ9HCW2_9NEOP|nr:hypothetical protein PR048_018558 [Dryococelus australis]
MAGRQVEIVQQWEERITALLQSESVLRNIVAFLTSAVVKVAVEELKGMLDTDLEEMRKLNTEIKSSNEVLEKIKYELALAADGLEQYQCHCSIQIFTVLGSEKENTDNLVLSVFCEKLGIPHVLLIDVDRSHRVRNNNVVKPRQIIVKFMSYNMRN